MNTKSILVTTALFSLLNLPLLAHAEFIDAFGASANVSTRTNCFAGLTCTVGDTIDSAADFGSGIVTATAEVIGAQAYADLNTTDGLPFLAAYAGVDATEGATARVEAIRKYEYTGVVPFSLQIDASYHAVLTGDSRNSMSGNVAIILVDPLNPTDDTVMSLLDSNTAIGGALFQVANGDFNNLIRDFQTVADVGDQSFTLSLTTELNPGDQFFLYNSFNLLSYDGGIADGLSSASLSTNLREFRVLERTSVVPVPAAAWLFGSGLIGLIGMARRKA